GPRKVEKGRHGLLRRTVEERLEDAGECWPAGALPGEARLVDIPVAVHGVADVPLVLEDTEHRAHGRVPGRIGQALEDLAGGRLALAVEDLHDLSFPPREVGEGLLRGHRSRLPTVPKSTAKKLACANFLAFVGELRDLPGKVSQEGSSVVGQRS